jgi:peptidoglycan L-alanyl-D-glutamate endopeptidase CwlK
MATTIKLLGVHPVLVQRVERILEAMRALGFPMLVTDGLRTAPEQMALYRRGRTQPGPIVTNADGITTRSNHQARDDGFGHAVDCAFLVEGKPSWSDDCPWRVYGEMAKALALRWGGDWKGFVDRPHVELP